MPCRRPAARAAARPAAPGALLFYFRLRAKALSPALTEARLQALQARIRPHFLFNSINAVLSLVRTDPRRAEVALEDMADLFRVLMRDNRELAPLADEVELCRQYLALEKLRLGERLQVEWHLQSMPGDALVPPLVLQPLLENAVYHGIEPSSAPGVVSINIFVKGGDVHAILRNPYQANGGRHHAGNKMAIANVRERLALHFDAEGALESRVVGNAYEVHLRMPYRAADSAAAAEPRRRRLGGRHTARPSRAEGGTPSAAAGFASPPRERCPMAEAPLRVLIVDDEAPARRRLRELLDDCAGALPLAIVGEAAQRPRGDGDPARGDGRPRAPRHPHAGDGRHRARAAPAEARSSRRWSIFTTAYHEHALEAFEVNAIDYLMKPVRVQRLLAALQKVPRLKPLTATKLDELPAVRAPVPVGHRALARRAGAARRDRLPQGRAQVHHDPHGAARVPARGIADPARGGVRRRASCASTATASSRATRSAASSAASATRATRTGRCC